MKRLESTEVGTHNPEKTSRYLVNTIVTIESSNKIFLRSFMKPTISKYLSGIRLGSRCQKHDFLEKRIHLLRVRMNSGINIRVNSARGEKILL